MKRFIILLLILCCFLTLPGCQKTVGQYEGKPLLSLTYEQVDYNGGWTDTYIFDFENNSVKKRGYLPGESEEPEFSEIAAFTDDEEAGFINKLCSYGLFDIKDNYPSPPGIIDGGGWCLTVEYRDGTVKRSTGSNNSPVSVFSKCAEAFYDICREGVVSYVPAEYYCPPNVSYTFRSVSANNAYGAYGKRADYKWNGFGSENNNVYNLNVSADFPQRFYEGTRYTLMLFTANYRNYDKFRNCIVSSYDFNEDLTDPTVEYSGGWFRQTELELRPDRIYTVRFEFDNGDFVVYTFNTITTGGDR
ncbi:MAG: hypothetical protein J5879_01895 [Clostridia bacterium]|nr:hypothetical protein [Clostridia bacterium]